MAGGIFVIGALGELPLPGFVGRLVVLELLVVWGYLALSYARSGLRSELSGSVRQPMGALAVGTWVAGSAVLGGALLEVLPGWKPLAFALWLVALVVWLWYLRLLPAAFRAAADPSGGYRANGAILLFTVGTQSLVVLGTAVLPGGMPRFAAVALIGLGYLFYAAGLVLIARRYLLRSDWTLADGWSNTNCILHGATSISGLAIVVSGALPGGWAVLTWWWAVVTFVLVEAVEAVRAFVRVRTHGWREGLSVYDPSQWSRNFTYGMFFTFTFDSTRAPSRSRGPRGCKRRSWPTASTSCWRYCWPKSACFSPTVSGLDLSATNPLAGPPRRAHEAAAQGDAVGLSAMQPPLGTPVQVWSIRG